MKKNILYIIIFLSVFTALKAKQVTIEQNFTDKKIEIILKNIPGQIFSTDGNFVKIQYDDEQQTASFRGNKIKISNIYPRENKFIPILYIPKKILSSINCTSVSLKFNEFQNLETLVAEDSVVDGNFLAINGSKIDLESSTVTLKLLNDNYFIDLKSESSIIEFPFTSRKGSGKTDIIIKAIFSTLSIQ